jgi:hypothetical protein
MRRAVLAALPAAVVAVSFSAFSAPVTPIAPPEPTGVRPPRPPRPPAPAPFPTVKVDEGCRPAAPAPLEAYFPFNGNAADATGHCHDAAVAGASLTPDRGGAVDKAYLFDNDDMIVLAREQGLDLSKFTIGFWFKVNALPRPWRPCPGVGCCAKQTLITKSSGQSPDHDGGNFNLSIFKCGGSSTVTLAYVHANAPAPGTTGPLQFTNIKDPKSFGVGQWQHAAVTYDGTTVRIFLNGNLSSSTSAPPPALNNQPVRLGRTGVVAAAEEFNQPFQGVLDEVRIYNDALPAAEVAKLPSMP